MVQFGITLAHLRKEEWAEYYIDYAGLKLQLKELKAAYKSAAEAAREEHGRDEGKHDSAEIFTKARGIRIQFQRSSTVHFLRRQLTMGSLGLEDQPGVNELETTFGATLDYQVETVVLFFLHMQGALAAKLLQARMGAAGHGLVEGAKALSSPSSSPADTYQVYREIGKQLVHLIRFLRLNVEALRKILKKHDKQVREKLIATYYLSSRAQDQYSSMRQLYNNEGILALVASLRNAFAAAEADSMQLAELHARLARFNNEPEGVVDLESSSQVVGKGVARATGGTKDAALSEVPVAHGVLGEIAEEQRALAAAQHQTVATYMSLEVLLGAHSYTIEEDVASEKARELDLPSAYINLATTFLYMTNYYIVGPTSAEYAAALGASPAVSGMIIGMTPIAACFSCLLYSWWTNTSFRGPLLLCSWMLVLGNLLYGLALAYEACWMVLLGRTLIGLGGARGVNRRYIADTIPIESRTVYSAAFVAAGALGMAFGPFLAALANDVEFELGKFEFNGMTNPGWIMFMCWVVMGVLIQTMFQEPPRNVTLDPNEWKTAKEPMADGAASEIAAPVDGGGVVNSSSPTETGYLTTNSVDAAGTRGNSYGATESTPSGDDRSSPATGKTVDLSDADSDRTGVGEAGRPSEPGNPVGTRGQPDQVDDLPSSRGGCGNGSVGLGEVSQESVPLLTFEDSRDEEEDEEEEEEEEEGNRRRGCGPLSAITPPLAFCLFGYFVNKLVTETAVSSAPLLTQFMFDWSVDQVGVLMAVLGLMVLPVNVLVGRLSQVVEDRILLQILAVLGGIGCLAIVQYPMLPFEYTEAQYIAGVSVTFIALQAHEGVIMSITSKIIPARLARGTWNSGFLATEAGTFGRFVGDFAITLMGLITLEWLDFLLFFPAVVLMLLMVIGFWVAYPFLQG